MCTTFEERERESIPLKLKPKNNIVNRPTYVLPFEWMVD